MLAQHPRHHPLQPSLFERHPLVLDSPSSSSTTNTSSIYQHHNPHNTTSTPSIYPSIDDDNTLHDNYSFAHVPLSNYSTHGQSFDPWSSASSSHFLALHHPHPSPSSQPSPIRVQQPTPLRQSSGEPSAMLSGNSTPQQSWDALNTHTPQFRPYSGFGQQQQSPVQNGFPHKRAPSSPGIASGGPSSPYTQTTSFPHIVQPSDSSSHSPLAFIGQLDGFGNADQAASMNFSKPFPVSTNFPQDSFFAPAFQNYNPSSDSESNLAAQFAMRQALMEQQNRAEDDAPDFYNSERPSESSIDHPSPPTPKTTYEEDEEEHKYTIDPRSNIPKLDRTISAVYEDELFNPDLSPSTPARKPIRQYNVNSQLSPYQNIFSQRIQAANNQHLNARSQSPAAHFSRERSPFRQGSPYAPSASTVPSLGSTRSPQAKLGTAAQIREQQKAEAEALAFRQSSQQSEQNTPKTISPKDALLDYHANDQDVPLFPQSANDSFGSQYLNQSSQGDHPGFATQHQDFSFAQPSIPSGVQGQQRYSFNNHQQRPQQQSNGFSLSQSSDKTPDFPSHLTSMESTSSEAQDSTPEIKRPAKTSADSGTYTCTYHGCTLRFETPSQLQKHKREGHRQTSPQTQSSPTGGMTSAAAVKNTQAGPHKCERINPSTGKPCNTIFSRPYDLTRHEDTIHNARKQKVRCQFCTEEKTFSRNDALTRHMRVVHPQIDFPGKSRRRTQD